MTILAFYKKLKKTALLPIVKRIKTGLRNAKNIGQLLFITFKNTIKTSQYQIKRNREKRRLQRLPWYLVLGSPHSGKKTLLANLGLYYAKATHFGFNAIEYINKFPDLEWWFSEQAIFIDPLKEDKERDVIAWKKLKKLLKKERRHKPFNGIILTFNIVDLVLMKNQDRQSFIQDIAYIIRDLHETFKVLAPIYIIFSKCDQIEGFMEFFNDMSKEEINQVWGMNFPLLEGSLCNSVQNLFNTKYHDLIEQLQKRVLFAFDSERNLRGRELILSFPQQMQLLRKPIETFLIELFAATRYQKALQMRGIYFISCKQDGKTFDFLLAAMSKKFQLPTPIKNQLHYVGECYFVRNLFFDVIQKEAHFLGDSEKSKRRQALAYNLCMIGVPLILLLSAITMYRGYHENLSNLKLVNYHISHYQNALNNLDQTKPSPTTILPLLDELHAALKIYQNKSWAMRSLYMSTIIEYSLNNALQNALQSLYLPRIAAQIENHLRQKITNQNLLYASLKGYLAFSASEYSKSRALIAPMEYYWNKSYLPESPTTHLLKYYLLTAIEKPIEKLPLDRSLINRIRGQLAAIIPENRAYGLLELNAKLSDIPDIILPSAIGENFDEVFPNISDVSIPAIYTRRFYETEFLKQYENIANEVTEDNQDIGLSNHENKKESSEQMTESLQITYSKNYINAWSQALANMKMLQFYNLPQAITLLNNITQKPSPLENLLYLIYENTNSLKNDDKIQIAKAFQALNNYSQNQSFRSSWQETKQTLKKLAKYLNQIATAQDPNSASLQATLDIIAHKPNPIFDLYQEAKNAPPPINNWLLTISDNCWQILVTNTHTKLNAAWATNVLPLYEKTIKDRYPIARNAEAQISIEDFNAFFGTSGILQNYFNVYIKPFINSNDKTWYLYASDAHTIQLSNESMAIFKKAEIIRNQFFAHDAKEVSLKFSITPRLLDSNARSMQLILGRTTLNYSHGPEYPIALTWPLPYDNQITQWMVSDFHGNQYTETENGPWSLFKLLQHGNLTATQNSGDYLLDLNLNNLKASFMLSGSADINTYQLKALNDFVLPNIVAPFTNNTDR